jgi:serine/threonine protein kinase
MPSYLDSYSDLLQDFETAWNEGGVSGALIENKLSNVKEPAASVLLYQLIRIELEHRLSEDWDALSAEFHRRFPLHEPVVAAVLAEVKPLPQARAVAPFDPNTTIGTIPVLDPVSPGMAVGPYVDLERIGRGGQGRLFSAQDSRTGQQVALKFLESQRSEDAGRFRREAMITAFLAERHPNIMPVYSLERQNSLQYIAMPYCRNGDLRSLVSDRPLSATRAAGYVIPVCRALHCAHRHNIIHRDVKPHNILLGEANHVYLADFGLAKVVSRRRTSHFRTNLYPYSGQQVAVTSEIPLDPEERRTGPRLFGTPAYMAPEQARDSVQVTFAADIYGVGATLYELTTGQPPVRASTQVILERILSQAFPLPRDINGEIPYYLEGIILRCLQAKPQLRYRTASAVAADLVRFVNAYPSSEPGTETASHIPLVAWLTDSRPIKPHHKATLMLELSRFPEANAGLPRREWRRHDLLITLFSRDMSIQPQHRVLLNRKASLSSVAFTITPHRSGDHTVLVTVLTAKELTLTHKFRIEVAVLATDDARSVSLER